MAGGGGTWASAAGMPQWLQIDFSGTRTISEVDVFSMQDNYTAPVEPDASLTAATYKATTPTSANPLRSNTSPTDVVAVPRPPPEAVPSA